MANDVRMMRRMAGPTQPQVHYSVVAKLLEQVIQAIRDAEAAGITRAEIARRTGIPNSLLSRLVNREREGLTLDTLEKLADALGLEVKITKPRKPRTKR